MVHLEGYTKPASLADVLLQEHVDLVSRRERLNTATKGRDTNISPAHDFLAQDMEIDPAKCTPPGLDDAGKEALYYEKTHSLGNVAALCLSGGGIRSAAFALGVIQSLASRAVLPQFDYLSTVSGGGYIGSWLTAWVQRRGYDDVLAQLPSNRPPSPDSPLSYLRRYSNYLTPRTGYFSADSLTVGVLYVRNLLLNWFVIVPFFVAAVLILKLSIDKASYLSRAHTEWLTSTALVLVGWALVDSLRQRPGAETAASGSFAFWRRELLPLMVGGVLASLATLSYLSSRIDASAATWLELTASLGIAGALVAGTAWLIAFYFSGASAAGTAQYRIEPSAPRQVSMVSYKHVRRAAVGFTIAGATTASLLGLGITYASALNSQFRIPVVLSFGPPYFILAIFFGDLIYSGVTSRAPWGDGEREWLGRSSGLQFFVACIWASVIALVAMEPILVKKLQQLFGDLATIYVGATGGLAGVIIAIFGKSPITPAQVTSAYRSIKSGSVDVLLSIAVPLFLISSLIATSYLLTGVVVSLSFSLILLAVLCIIGFLSSICVNINRFSLHGVYRNRIVRTFLGASNSNRTQNPFTDFDQSDNMAMADLWPSKNTSPQWIPPHLLVINMALNVVATKELAWRERKALSFVTTARWAGSGELARNDRRKGCFRPVKEYGGSISLGAAVTISGAAASPNMGYHSSPVLSLLLTMFNVRLGAWYGNPAEAGSRSYREEGPANAARPLLYEAFGQTTEQREYIYLSDGGHFENLGLYEMVRRRCRFILVSDAGYDPKCGFEDLGNAVRKVSVDFGVQIAFDDLRIAARQTPPGHGPCAAVATIVYPECPDQPGTLLYLKPCFRGTEPASARSYGELHPEFPHESTADQWFGETQFEAYRALGEYTADTLIGESELSSSPTIEEFFKAAAANLMRDSGRAGSIKVSA